MVFGFLCGISARYVFRSSMSETKDAWKVLTTVILAGIINSFVVGVLTFTWYQVAVMGTEGAFWGLAAANFLSRLATKPVTIVASAWWYSWSTGRLTGPWSPGSYPGPGVSARGQRRASPFTYYIIMNKKFRYST